MQDSGKETQTGKQAHRLQTETERDAHVDTEKKTWETGIKRVCTYKANPQKKNKKNKKKTTHTHKNRKTNKQLKNKHTQNNNNHTHQKQQKQQQ